MGYVWCVTCVMSHVTCHVLHVACHVTNVMKILVSAMFLIQVWCKDHNDVSHLSCYMSHIMCNMSHDMWHVLHNTGMCNVFEARVTQGSQWDMCDMSFVKSHVTSHVTWHATYITKILASAMFFKPGWLKDHIGTCVICHMWHVMCHLSHVTWHVTDVSKY